MALLLPGLRAKASCRSVTKALTVWAAYGEERWKSGHLLLKRKTEGPGWTIKEIKAICIENKLFLFSPSHLTCIFKISSIQSQLKLKCCVFLYINAGYSPSYWTSCSHGLISDALAHKQTPDGVFPICISNLRLLSCKREVAPWFLGMDYNIYAACIICAW